MYILVLLKFTPLEFETFFSCLFQLVNFER